jgi:PAS domain S-box-containing protein
MAANNENLVADTAESPEDIARFTESYATFNRIINSLRRQYIDLKEEFGTQNERLAATNARLVEVSGHHAAATEFLNGILQSLSAGVIAVNRQGEITHFNSAASLLLGIPSKEPIGKRYRDIIPHGEPVDANALRAVETGNEATGVEKNIVLGDGTRLHLAVSTAIIRDADGNRTGAVEVLHDISRNKKMEQEIARLNTLAALGEMAATIAHEVRNPLAGIGGFAALLKRDMAIDDSRQKLVSKIIRGVDSLNNTITTLLNYTRFDEINREDTDFGLFLNSSVEQFRLERADKLNGTSITTRPAQGPPSGKIVLRVDRELLRQVLTNLFVNAAEACRGEGEIEVSLSRLPRQKATRLYGERLVLGIDETVVEVCVADSGPGIEEEHIDHIFAPFYTTREGGNGLGLAMAWKIIKGHGGEIVVENREQGGAEFRLVIPTRIESANMESPQ